MQMVLVGTSMWITNTTAIPIGNTTFTFTFGGGSIGKLPLLLLWVLITGAVGYIVLNRTPYGKKVLAVGGNATSCPLFRHQRQEDRGLRLRLQQRWPRWAACCTPDV